MGKELDSLYKYLMGLNEYSLEALRYCNGLLTNYSELKQADLEALRDRLYNINTLIASKCGDIEYKKLTADK